MSAKGSLAISDFTIAAKAQTTAPEANSDASPTNQERPQAVERWPTGHPDNKQSDLPMPSSADREKRARERAASQESARYSLKNLKRARQREIKFYVNVPLDQATKGRLKRAADENDIKMATVMKAAIDFYLKENGY